MNSTIGWLPFSQCHIDYITKSKDCVANIAEGAVRAGKTIDNCIAFALNLEYSPDKIHLASGSTLANAKLNIGECNGFGLEHQFRGRCRWGKYKDNEALFVQTKTGEKIILFAGGGLANSYKKILGNSYGMWIATEINEHYDDDDSKISFIKVAFARMLASKKRKWFWDLNPSNPNATIYEWYIDLWSKQGLIGGYNYQHFTIFDNQAITEQRRLEIISQYDQNSIWYQRDILGLRVVAEGRIYQEFAEHHILKMSDWLQEGTFANNLKKELAFITIGVDFGGTQSAHSFTATGITKQFKQSIVIKNKNIKEYRTPSDLEQNFVDFIRSVKNSCPNVNIIDIRCDSAEQVLINGFKRALREAQIGIPINNALKSEILQRIKFSCKMFSMNKMYVLEECSSLIGAIRTAMWEKKKVDVRLDDGIQNVDDLDSWEYSNEPYMKPLLTIN